MPKVRHRPRTRSLTAAKARSAQLLPHSTPTFTTAKGSILTETKEGREYIDFLAGCSSLNYGQQRR